MKSLFSKVFLTSALILIIGVGVITFGLNLLYKIYLFDESQKELLTLAENLSENIEKDYEKNREVMLALKNYKGIEISMLIDDIILYDDEEKNINNLSKKIDYNIISSYKKNTPYEEEYLIYRDNDNYSLIYPVNNGIILFLNKPLSGLNKSISQVNYFSLIALIIVVSYTIMISSLIYKKIIDEVGKVNRAVKSMSKGNLDVELETNRKDEFGELSRNLSEMGKSLMEIEDARRKFVSNVSHDLRSPMTSISGYVNGILDGTIPEEKWRYYLSIVSEESKRMIKLINDTLDLSKIQSGKYELSISEIDLNSLILTVVDSFEQRIIEKNVNIELDFMDGYCASCDEMLIIRVVGNLVDNAIKFVDKSGTISIKTEFKDDRVFVGINNTGSYIEESKLKDVWGRFNKLDDSRSMDKNSSGLGLAIVKEIITSHGEKIDVYSDEKEGTLFVFSLKACEL